MKTNFLIILLAFISIISFAQQKDEKTSSAKVVTANFKVFGNCGECKDRIEKSLDTKGVKQAKWNVTTKNLEVVYMPGKISEQKIREIVSASGHDTETTKAPDKVYAKLPFCCLYRDHDHSGIQDSPKKDN